MLAWNSGAILLPLPPDYQENECASSCLASDLLKVGNILTIYRQENEGSEMCPQWPWLVRAEVDFESGPV